MEGMEVVSKSTLQARFCDGLYVRCVSIGHHSADHLPTVTSFFVPDTSLIHMVPLPSLPCLSL